jgi:nitrogen regulatory protein P-II 1
MHSHPPQGESANARRWQLLSSIASLAISAGGERVARQGQKIPGKSVVLSWHSLQISQAARGSTLMMTKVEAIIQPSKLDAVKEALSELGVEGLTISEVRGHGRQKGHTESYRGREYSVDLLPKIKIESVMDDSQVDAVVKAILETAATGKIGDGKIFLSKVEEAIRIRNQERGVAAL